MSDVGKVSLSAYEALGRANVTWQFESSGRGAEWLFGLCNSKIRSRLPPEIRLCICTFPHSLIAGFDTKHGRGNL